MALTPLVLSQLPADGLIGKEVYRCAGRCTEGQFSEENPRPRNHGMFLLPLGTNDVKCPECGALAVRQEASAASTDSSDDFVAATPAARGMLSSSYVGNPADRSNGP